MSISASYEQACLSRELEAEKKQAAHDEFVYDNMEFFDEYKELIGKMRFVIKTGNKQRLMDYVKELEQLAYAHQEELAKLDWDECVERGE